MPGGPPTTHRGAKLPEARGKKAMLRGITAILLVLVPAFGAASEYGFEGFLAGGCIGLALAGLLDARRRLSVLESELAALRERTAARPAPILAPEEVSEPAEVPVAGKPAAEPELIQFEIEPATDAPGPEAERVASAPTPAPSPAVSFLLRLITGGNLLVKIGLLVLFVGVSFLVKYASERNLLPIELRLAGAALGGVALIAVGWRLRQRRENYALTLQGGGIGILYLVVFAAFRIYDLMPPGFAFAFLLVLCVLSACLAVLQNSQSLAIFGAAGGFLAPILTSTGRGSHVMLFSYYALLDAGILGIAWFKAWRPLNLTGFLFTFGLGTFWGYGYYTPAHFASTEPFLVIFFVFYTAISVLFALRQPPQLKGYVDGTLVFGTPLIVFAQQVAMVRPYEFGAALSAVCMGVFYLAAARVLFRWKAAEMRLLCEAFLAVGVGFGTIAIPLAFEYRGVAATWALEGAGLLWVGVRQERLLARVSGMLLQVGAGMALLPIILEIKPVSGGIPVLNGVFLGGVLIALAGLFSSRLLARNSMRLRVWEVSIAPLFGAWGLFWWYGTGLREIDKHTGRGFRIGAAGIFVSLSCAACEFFRKRLDWQLLRYPALGLLPAMFLLLAPSAGHPFGQGGYAGWPVALACLYWIFYQNEDLEEKISAWFHAGGLWLLAVLLAWEIGWQVDSFTGGRGSWVEFAIGVSVSALWMLCVVRGHTVRWPIARHYRAYLWLGLAPIAVAAWFSALVTGILDPGDPWPLTYLPIANPLDLAVGFTYLALLYWLFRLPSLHVTLPETFQSFMPQVLSGAGFSIFLWLSATLVRCMHYWGGVPLTSHDLMRSVLVQAGLSIFWTVTSFVLMVHATRKGMRTLWFSGAALLGIVVVKLFLIDLSGSGTVERIVSFVGVGVLILIVGYMSPVPPQDKGARDTQ